MTEKDQKTARPALMASERLMHCTVRLEMPDLRGRTGTGFFFLLLNHEGRNLPAIVTNSHVIDGANRVFFRLTKADGDGFPVIGQTTLVQLNDVAKRTVRHPDVDLAAILIGDVLAELVNRGEAPFIAPLEQSFIPTGLAMKQLAPLESVLTVGYPGQLWDDVNNLPLFHRGNTATAPYIDFKGRKEFLVDFATWPGASGSPVFVFNEGGYFDARTGNTYVGRSRILLIGVVYGVAVQEVTGKVVIEQAPTVFGPTSLVAASNIPTNLGACLRAERILELEPLLFNLGIVAPPGYVPRTS